MIIQLLHEYVNRADPLPWRMTEQADDTTDRGVRWWELAGHYDLPALHAQWDQLARAARVTASLTAGPAREASLAWIPGDRLPDQFFAAQPSEAPSLLRPVLRPWDLRLFAVDPAGSPIGALELVGQSPERVTGWFESLTARPAEPGTPSDRLPDGPFPPTNQLAVAEIIRVYANTDALLGRIASSLGAAEPVVHGATLTAMLRLNRHNAGVRAIGLEPPSDGRDARWFVQATAGAAYLTLAQVTSTHNPAEQHALVQGFFADALRV